MLATKEKQELRRYQKASTCAKAELDAYEQKKFELSIENCRFLTSCYSV